MKNYVVARTEDVPEGGSISVEVKGRTYGIFNVGGTFHALLDRCPHQGAALSRGACIATIESDTPGEYRFGTSRTLIMCPWHGWEFDIETGQSWFDAARTRALSVDVNVEHGEDLAAWLHESQQTGARLPGPYIAEVHEVHREDDYIVLVLPR